MRLDGKAKECVAKLREIISESRLLIVPAAFAVAKFLGSFTVHTLVSVGVCANGNVNGKVVPIDLLNKCQANGDGAVAGAVVNLLVAIYNSVACLKLLHVR